MTLEQLQEEMTALPLEVRSKPAALFAAALGLYEHERIEATSLEDDEDMLLFQWGCYNWGDGLFFELDLTRQTIHHTVEEAEDPDIRQLRCTFLFEPSAFEHLAPGNRWCHSPEELPDFAPFVLESKALNLARIHQHLALKIQTASAE
ncbi:MAG TPA: hypothetical protein VNN08_01405 [Thermoanaerobaculia bacterium]|nr:hypothetical protein [Thermoanaerobaculia bacterium]